MPRVKIMQDGRVVGTLPRPEGDPKGVVRVQERQDMTFEFSSVSPMTTLRSYDLVTEMFVTEDGWAREIRLVADPKLGPGDLENIEGFRHATS